MSEHFMRQPRKIVALGRQQAFPVYGLSKSSLDALRVHQAGSLPHTGFQPANDIVLANIALVKTLSEKNPRTNHSQGQSTSSDIYAGVAPAAAAHELIPRIHSRPRDVTEESNCPPRCSVRPD